MSNGYLTTHVLDIYNGVPGKGIRGAIFLIENENKKKIKEFKLNDDGRSDSPILEKNEFGQIFITDTHRERVEDALKDSSNKEEIFNIQ